MSKLAKHIPILQWVRTYKISDIRFDLIAGIVVAGLIIPESMGIAGVAGVQPQHGLYAILVALFLYAIFGSGKRSIVSTPSAMGILAATAIASLALTQYEDVLAAVVTITVLVGAILAVMAVLRLGVLANLISYPVMKGFLFGLALTIIIGQVPKLLGVPKGNGNFFEQLWQILGSLDQTNLFTLGLALIAIVVLFVLEERFKKIPAVLLLFVLGISLSYFLGWEGQGVEIVGTIPSGLPSLVIPEFNPQLIYLVIPAAIGIAFVCFSEGVAIGQEVAERHKDEIDPDQELLAMAATNLGSGMVQGIGTGVSMSASYTGDKSGSKSQMTLVIAGLVVMVVLLFLTGVFYYLPEFVLGVIVIFAVKGALKFRQMASFYRLMRLDFYCAMAALFGVLIFEVLVGLLLAIVLALVLVIWKISHESGSILGRTPEGEYRDIAFHPDAREIEGVKIYRLNIDMFYVNAPVVKKRLLDILRFEPKIRLLIIDLEVHTRRFDVTASKGLMSVIQVARDRSIEVALVHVHSMALKDLEVEGVIDLLGRENIYRDIEQAILKRVGREQLG